MLDTFKSKLESLRGHVHVADSYEQAVGVIASVCENMKADCMATAQLPEALLRLLADAASLQSVDVLTAPYPADALPMALDRAQVGVTGIEFAIAETGTLVEVSTNDETRLVSSLPRTHIGVVHQRDLVPDLRGSASRLREILLSNDSNCVVSYISGPSRTGDIEMRLTLGVHGPENEHAIILTGEDM